MKMRMRIPLAVWAVAVVSLVAGFLAITPQVASAAPNAWYVTTTGTDNNNTCANQARPCATISHALIEQGLSNSTGTIHVAAGTYNEQLSITNANDKVKLVGAGAGTIVQPPAGTLSSDMDTDSGNPQFYVISVAPATHGVKIEDLSVNGLTASSYLDSDGDGCSQDFVGIYMYESSGTIKNVSVTGIDMPPDLYGCQGGQGIYANSGATPTTVNVTNASLLSPAPTVTTKADLPAGTYNDDQLATTKLPAGFSSGPVLVNGTEMQAARDSNKVLFVTGTTTVDSPSGSTVRFDPYTPAYDKNGITCDDNNTTCNITGGSVQGEGPTNGIAQNGIQDFGAANVTVNGTTVSDDSYAGGGGPGNAASGILVLNAGTVNVENANVSNSDVNIYAGEIPAYGLVATPGTWTIQNNTVSGATSTGASAGEDGYGEGIQVDSTTNNVQVEGNTVSNSAQANVLLTGVTGATIGHQGGGGSGNTLTGTFFQTFSEAAGMVVGGPGSACESTPPCNPGDPGYGSTGNTIIDNTLTDNAAGIVVEGTYAPQLFGGSNPYAAFSNTFGGNQISESEINAVDFSGFYNNGGMDQPPSQVILNQWGPNDPVMGQPVPDNSCDPVPGGNGVTGANIYAC